VDVTIGWMNELHNPLFERVNPRMLASEPIQRCCLDDCHGACCVFGVWVDEREKNEILANAALILPHMPLTGQEPADWFADMESKDERIIHKKVIHTGVETVPDHYGGTACTFWRDDGKCALQVAAVSNNLHPWRFKPYYCILHPLDLDEKGRITLDAVEEMVDEPGSCVRRHSAPVPLSTTFEPELKYLLGEKAYSTFCSLTNKADSTSDQSGNKLK
jgi:hypothetical protein